MKNNEVTNFNISKANKTQIFFVKYLFSEYSYKHVIYMYIFMNFKASVFLEKRGLRFTAYILCKPEVCIKILFRFFIFSLSMTNQ